MHLTWLCSFILFCFMRWCETVMPFFSRKRLFFSSLAPCPSIHLNVASSQPFHSSIGLDWIGPSWMQATGTITKATKRRALYRVCGVTCSALLLGTSVSRVSVNLVNQEKREQNTRVRHGETQRNAGIGRLMLPLTWFLILTDGVKNPTVRLTLSPSLSLLCVPSHIILRTPIHP